MPAPTFDRRQSYFLGFILLEMHIYVALTGITAARAVERAVAFDGDQRGHSRMNRKGRFFGKIKPAHSCICNLRIDVGEIFGQW